MKTTERHDQILGLLANPELLVQGDLGNGLAISDLGHHLKTAAVHLKNPVNDLIRVGYIQSYLSGVIYHYRLTNNGRVYLGLEVAIA